MPSLRPPFQFAFCALGLAGCHRSHSGTPVTPAAPAIVGAVTITANDNAWVPQVAVIRVETDVPTRVELHLTDGIHSWQTLADPAYVTMHDRVPVVGMRPGRDHTIEVTVRDSYGSATTAPAALEFTTPFLPQDFPPIEVGVSMPAFMEEGARLLSILTAQLGSVPTIIDADGEVLWHFDASQTPLRDEQVMAFPLQNGNLMLIGAWQLMIEVDMLGDMVRIFRASGLTGPWPCTISVDTDSFHHDFVELPPGSDADFAVLGTERRTLPNYPANVVDPTQTVPNTEVIGDEIVEFKTDGTVVRRIRLLDVLDPYRMTYDTLGNFWDDYYGIPTVDWSHANALVLDERTDSWIVSLRHQDAVVQINRQTGQLEWILGDHARWNAPWDQHLLTPVGRPFEWQYHQHAPQLQPDGSILMFDNGNGRAIPPAPALPPAEAYSRAVRYRVDAGVQTVEQLWVYGGPPNTGQPSFYSFFVSSARSMPATGNVLVCDGGEPAGGGRMYGRVFEVTTEPVPQVVFDCEVRGDGINNTESYFIYRAYRLPW